MWINNRFLATLSEQQYRSGYAEMLKHGLIADPSYWKKLSFFVQAHSDSLLESIYHSVGIKNEVVKKDPKEQGWRKILNFGHTLGHAVESYALESLDQKTCFTGKPSRLE